MDGELPCDGEPAASVPTFSANTHDADRRGVYKAGGGRVREAMGLRWCVLLLECVLLLVMCCNTRMCSLTRCVTFDTVLTHATKPQHRNPQGNR